MFYRIILIVVLSLGAFRNVLGQTKPDIETRLSIIVNEKANHKDSMHYIYAGLSIINHTNKKIYIPTLSNSYGLHGGSIKMFRVEKNSLIPVPLPSAYEGIDSIVGKWGRFVRHRKGFLIHLSNISKDSMLKLRRSNPINPLSVTGIPGSTFLKPHEEIEVLLTKDISHYKGVYRDATGWVHMNSKPVSGFFKIYFEYNWKSIKDMKTYPEYIQGYKRVLIYLKSNVIYFRAL